MSEKTNKPKTSGESQKHEYSDKELKEMYEKNQQFYKEQIVGLKIQFDYFDLLAKIEEAKTRRIEAMYKASNLFAQAELAEKQYNESLKEESFKKEYPSSKFPKEDNTLGKKRKLKKS